VVVTVQALVVTRDLTEVGCGAGIRHCALPSARHGWGVVAQSLEGRVGDVEMVG
jgi:hypothetical protein